MQQPLLNEHFFTKKRDQLLQQLPANSAVLLSSTQTNPPEYNPKRHWQQNADFYYLTGIESHGCHLLLLKGSHAADVQLFIPEQDALIEKWEGTMLNPQQAAQISGINTVKGIGHFQHALQKQLLRVDNLFVQNIFTPLDSGATAYQQMIANIRVHYPALNIKNANQIIDKMRWLKEPEEIEVVKKAIAITGQALPKIAQQMKPGAYEYQIEAEVAYQYRKNGASGCAFPPIVAAGKNSCCLHYNRASDVLIDGQILLLDAGATYQNYHADITRVFPIGGKFSDFAAKVYETTLKIQQKTIENLRVGMSVQEYFNLCLSWQKELLLSEKLIASDENFKEYTIHNVGHSLGLNVHDRFALEYTFAPGTLITVEPGLYFPREQVGVRIEDNVLFHENTVEVLSSEIPKDLKAIEAMMA